MTAVWGQSRWGMKKNGAAIALSKLSTEFTRLIPNFNVERSSTTGRKNPTYEDKNTQDIQGMLYEVARPTMYFPFGAIPVVAGTFITVDGLEVGDLIRDEHTGKVFTVETSSEFNHPEGGFFYRVCRVKKVQFRWKPI